MTSRRTLSSRLSSPIKKRHWLADVSALRCRDLLRWAQRTDVLAQIEVEEFKQPLAFLSVERSSPLAETVPDSHAEADDRARSEIGRPVIIAVGGLVASLDRGEACTAGQPRYEPGSESVEGIAA